MQDYKKSKAELVQEISELRQRVRQLENGGEGGNGQQILAGLFDEAISTAHGAAQSGWYRRLFEVNTEAMMLLDVEAGFIECNQATLDLFYFEIKRDFLFTHFDRHSPPVQPDGCESREAIKEHITTALEQGAHRFEWQCRRTDGTIFPADILLNSIHAGNKDLIYVAIRDITVEKETEAALRRSEAHNQAVLASVPDLIFTVKRDGTVLDVHGGHDAELYRELHQIIGKRVDKILPAHLAEQRMYYIEEAFITGQMQSFEYEIEIGGQLHYEEGRIIVSGDDQVLNFVRDVTHHKHTEIELARRVGELETVGRVSAAVSTILEVEELLQGVVDLTKEQFALYHVHIYLLNEAGDTLELVAGTGDVGRAMVGQRWQIPYAREQSLVAQAARSRQGVIVNNVRVVPDWLPNPLLPDTFAELAVPLIVGDTVLGVLDLQADQVDYFTEADVRIQNTLAAQIAVALQNARLYAQTQSALADQQATAFLLRERVKELNCLNEISREIAAAPPVPSFLQWVTERIPPAMQLPDLSMAAIEFDQEIYGSPAALEAPAKIVQALRISGEVVGRVHIAYREKRDFLDEESALIGGIASRVSGYLESDRLTAQSQSALQNVRQSQELLQSIIDSTPDWIFIKDRNHRYRMVNQGYARSLNILPQEFIGKNDLELGFPEDIVKGNPDKGITGFWSDDSEVMESGETKVIPSEPAEVGGKKMYLSTIKVPLRGARGEVEGVLGIVRDITEREQLLAEVQRLAAIVENHPDFIAMGPLDGRVRYVNPAGLRMIGRSPDYDVTHMDISDFFAPENAALLIKEGMPAALEGGVWISEVQLQHVDGRSIPAEATVSVNYDAEGRPHSFSLTMRNISERKMAEAERERLLAEVETAYRQYVAREWQQFLGEQRQGHWLVEYEGQQLPDNSNVASIETPIALRGQEIGRLRLEDIDPARRWTAEEQALLETVSEQVALTIENLRLFDETRQRATREQLTREITDKMRAAPDVETILQTGLGELAQALGVSRTYVKLSPDLKQFADGQDTDGNDGAE